MTILNPVLPLCIDFKSWANQLRIASGPYSFPIANDVSGWREWAETVVLENNFTNVPIPAKHVFPNDEDWKTWGAYLIQTIYNTN